MCRSSAIYGPADCSFTPRRHASWRRNERSAGRRVGVLLDKITALTSRLGLATYAKKAAPQELELPGARIDWLEPIMKDGSRPARNRHGIPVYGGGPSRCRWDKCVRPVQSYHDLRLCDVHADIVHAAVEREKATAERVELEAINRHAQRYADEYGQPDAPVTAVERAATIYYVRVGSYIKIGWTSNLDGRMRQYPPGCELLAVHPGTRDEEKALHKRFAVWRSHGREWYPLAPVILEHVARVVSEYGKPDDATFGAQPVTVPTSRERKPVAMRPRSGGRARHIA